MRAEFSASDDGLKIVASNYAGLIAGLALLVAAVALVILLDVRNRRAKRTAQNAEGSATDEGGSVEGVKPSGVVFDGAADNKRVSRTDIIKAQRLFRKKDMIIFGALLLCIILLFGFVVFGAPRGALSAVEIYFDGEKFFLTTYKRAGSNAKTAFTVSRRRKSATRFSYRWRPKRASTKSKSKATAKPKSLKATAAADSAKAPRMR